MAERKKGKDQRSKVCKPEYCARCAKKMGEDPKVQSDRIMLYFSENHVEEYVCPICGYVIKKAILREPAKLHRYLQEQDLEDIEHEPRFRPIGFCLWLLYAFSGIGRFLTTLGPLGSLTSMLLFPIPFIMGVFIGDGIGKRRNYRLPLSPWEETIHARENQRRE